MWSIIKKIAQFGRYIFYRYFKYLYFKPFKLYFNETLIKISQTDNSFFGYYNLSPENLKNQVSYLHLKDTRSKIGVTDAMIMISENNLNREKKVFTTSSWNLQQGCMLQWLPPNFQNLIFNDYDFTNEKYISRIIDVNGNVINTLNHPIYSISLNGEFALSLNFKRLAALRPAYGYFSQKYGTLESNDKDGITYLDLHTNEFKLILTLERIIKLKPVFTMEGATHKVNHIDICPDGSRFMFLHRWVGPHGRFHRLITANVSGEDLFILNGDKMTSHCCWVNSTEIISFCHVDGLGTGYYKFYDKTDIKELVSTKLPNTDGHPSVSPDKKLLVLDTYPDLARMAYLYLFDIDSDKLYKVGRFFQSLRFTGDYRIDLHPKWSLDGKYIYFESGHIGNRNLYRIGIPPELNKSIIIST